MASEHGHGGMGRCPDVGKVRYTYANAQALAKHQRRRDGEPSSAYHCDVCKDWHVGHTPIRLRRRRSWRRR